MLFQINFKAGKPAYLQLVDQVKTAVASGSLQAGDSLPSIRPLSEELRLNRNTVAKAYTELESQGVIETAPGKGCFVAENNSPLKKEVRRKMLSDEIDAAIAAGHTRIRPVLMTAAAMIVGMIPMAIGGPGEEQNAALARAVIGGLLFATPTTLLVVPYLFAMLRKRNDGKPARGVFAEEL